MALVVTPSLVMASQSQNGLTGRRAGSNRDTPLPRMTWVNAASITVAAYPQRPSIVYRTLQDGFQRSFSGTLTFDFANGIADGGLDEGSEQVSTWYYFYLVPSTSDDGTLAIRASDNAPSTGPTGFSNYQYIGAVRNDSSSDLLQFIQIEAEFFYANPPTPLSSVNVAAESDWVEMDISSHVPETARMFYVQTKIDTAGSQQTRLVVSGRNVGDSGDPDEVIRQVLADSRDNAGNNTDITSWLIPLFTTQTIYRRIRLALGSGTISFAEMRSIGYVDDALEQA